VKTMKIKDTLEKRGNKYGEFAGHAAISQDLKKAMSGNSAWKYLSPDKKEALEMIAHKIARILNGDPEWHDSWHDIEGYAKLVADTLRED